MIKAFNDIGNFAIMVVDLQNDFCDNKGVFASLGLNVEPAQKVTQRIIDFLDRIKVKNVPVIFTKQIESAKITPLNLKRQFSNDKLKAVCAPNSWGADFYKIKPKNKDYVIEKHTYDVFSNPQTDEILKRHEIKTLIITGVNTDVCVDTTLRSAFTRGYQIIVPKDLVGTMNTQGEEYYLKIFDRFFGDVVHSQDIIGYLDKK